MSLGAASEYTLQDIDVMASLFWYMEDIAMALDDTSNLFLEELFATKPELTEQEKDLYRWPEYGWDEKTSRDAYYQWVEDQDPRQDEAEMAGYGATWWMIHDHRLQVCEFLIKFAGAPIEGLNGEQYLSILLDEYRMGLYGEQHMITFSGMKKKDGTLREYVVQFNQNGTIELFEDNGEDPKTGRPRRSFYKCWPNAETAAARMLALELANEEAANLPQFVAKYDAAVEKITEALREMMNEQA